MPVVLVHGNPETDAIWTELRAALSRDDVLALSPPGFGAPAPESFGGTSDDYRDWLIGELEAIDEPADLVGHDWGGGHVMRVAIERPDLLRSWCTDIAGVFNEEYIWHDFAQIWQSDQGEGAIEQMMAQPEADWAAGMTALGMSDAAARDAAAARGPEMGRCILALYRSAAQPALGLLGKALPRAAARPGLVIAAEGDTFVGGEALARRAAGCAEAQVAVLTGVGHWWMCQDPAQGAKVLEEFWGGLDGRGSA